MKIGYGRQKQLMGLRNWLGLLEGTCAHWIDGSILWNLTETAQGSEEAG
jgi:hypothetical protein